VIEVGLEDTSLLFRLRRKPLEYSNHFIAKNKKFASDVIRVPYGKMPLPGVLLECSGEVVLEGDDGDWTSVNETEVFEHPVKAAIPHAPGVDFRHAGLQGVIEDPEEERLQISFPAWEREIIGDNKGRHIGVENNPVYQVCDDSSFLSQNIEMVFIGILKIAPLHGLPVPCEDKIKLAPGFFPKIIPFLRNIFQFFT